MIARLLAAAQYFDPTGSILLADGKLFVTNLEGETFVVRPGPDFELLARNNIGETTYAALAPSNGDFPAHLRSPVLYPSDGSITRVLSDSIGCHSKRRHRLLVQGRLSFTITDRT